MATGRPGFSGKTMATLFDAILNKDPAPIGELDPNLPAELGRIVAKALEKDRDLRYRNAADIRADLKRLRRDSDVRPPSRSAALPASPVAATSAPPPPDSAVVINLVKRHRAGLAVAAVLLFSAVAGAVWMTSRRSPRADNVTEIPLDRLQVTQLTSTGNASRPAISPDGKYVVYLQAENDAGFSVWLRQTGATNSVKILPADATQPALAATIGPGSTFVDVQRATSLWRVPFLGGTPKLILDRVTMPIGWSPDGTHMAFVRPGSKTLGSDLVIANSEGQDQRVLVSRTFPATFVTTSLAGATVVAPAWSPDGRRIALIQRLGEDVREMGVAVFDVSTGQDQIVNVRGDVPQGLGWLDPSALVVGQALEQGTASQLWRISFPEGRRTRLTNDVNRYSELSLSADADSLVTSRPETRLSIWVGDANGSGRDVIRSAPFLSSAITYATVAWDGDRLLFTHTLNGRFEIFRSDVASAGAPEALAAGRDMTSGPDGSIIFRSIAGDDAGLWRVDRNGRQPIQLMKGSVNLPSVTPDGQQVVFSAPVGSVQAIWAVPISGGTPTQIVNQSVGVLAFSDVSPDGKSIALVLDRQWTVCDFPACAQRRPLTLSGSRPRWMPDGRALSYVDQQGTNIWAQPIDGSPARQLTHFADGQSIGHYAWSRDGRRLAVSRAMFSSDIVLFKGLRLRP
jgi:eukaryotic-like serine/threonine-protein kinase